MTEDGANKVMVLDLLESMGSELEKLREIVVVADDHTPSEVLAALKAFPKVVLELFKEPFNFSKKCNIGAHTASSDVVMFLNDDMLALGTGWVDEVQRYLADETVGGVGGLLLTPDGLVQCAGHANAPRPHMYGVGLDPKNPALRERLLVPRECGGLSGACFAVRKAAYVAVGGMCEKLPNSYNDVDLGFKLQTLQKRLMYIPSIRFVHYESISRNPSVGTEETALIWARWGRHFEHDPFMTSAT